MAGDLEPIVVTVDVAAAPADAYAAFTAGFGEWWPVATHSLSRTETTRCSLAGTPGGALEEQAPDGTRYLWGTVQAAEPGRRLRFSWHPGREAESAQWVEVVFAPAGGGSTVTLTHGGWEALGEIAPILRREYVAGWQKVLDDRFARFAGGVR
jgi:uncharacterized protein YndB with AHSA1/START domain